MDENVGASAQNLDIVMEEIYKSCDVEKSDKVAATTLINYIKPYMKNCMKQFRELEVALDPNCDNPAISSASFYQIMKEWAHRINPEGDAEATNDVTPKNATEIKTELHPPTSTPRESFGRRLGENLDLNISNVSSYSFNIANVSDGGLDKTQLEEQIKFYEEKYLSATHELASVKLQLALAEEQNQELQGDLDRISRRLQSEQQVNEHLLKHKKEQEDFREEVAYTKKEIENLQNMLSDTKKENANLNNVIRQLQTEKEDLEQKVEDYRKKEQEAKKLLLELNELKSEVDIKELEILKLVNANELLNLRIKEQSGLIEDYTNRNELLKQENSNLEKALWEIKKNEYMMQNSATNTSASPQGVALGILNFNRYTNTRRSSFNTPTLLKQLGNPVSPTLGSPLYLSPDLAKNPRQDNFTSTPITIPEEEVPLNESSISSVASPISCVVSPISSVVSPVASVASPDARATSRSDAFITCFSTNSDNQSRNVVLDANGSGEFSSDDDVCWRKQSCSGSVSGNYESLHSEISQATGIGDNEQSQPPQGCNCATKVIYLLEENTNYRNSVEELKCEIELIKKEKEESVRLQRELKAEKSDLVTRLKNAEDSRAELESKLAEINLERDRTTAINNKLSDDNQSLNTVLASKSQELLQVENRLTKLAELESEILDYKCKLESNNQEIKDLTQKLQLDNRFQKVLRDKIQTELIQKSMKLEDLRVANIQLQQNVDALKAELEMTRGEVESLKSKCQTKTSIEELLQQDIELLKNKIDELKIENEKLTKLNNAKEEDLNAMRQIIQAKQDVIDSLEKQLLIKDNKYKDLETLVEDINDERETLRKKSLDQINIFHTSQNNLKTELEKLKQEFDKLSFKNQNLTELLKNKEKTIEIAEQKTLQTEQEFKEVVEQLSILHSTMSLPEMNAAGDIKSFVDVIVKRTKSELSKLELLQNDYQTFQSRIDLLQKENEILMTETKQTRISCSCGNVKQYEPDPRKSTYDKQQTKIDKLQEQVDDLKLQLQAQNAKHQDVATFTERSLAMAVREKIEIEREREKIFENVRLLQIEVESLREANEELRRKYENDITDTQMMHLQEKQSLQEEMMLMQNKFDEDFGRLKQQFKAEEDQLIKDNIELETKYHSLNKELAQKNCVVTHMQEEARKLKLENSKLLEKLEIEMDKNATLGNSISNLSLKFEGLKSKEVDNAVKKYKVELAQALEKVAFQEKTLSLMEDVFVQRTIELYNATVLAFSNWKIVLTKLAMENESVKNLLDKLKTLIPIKEKKITQMIEEELLNINSHLIASTHLLQILAQEHPKPVDEIPQPPPTKPDRGLAKRSSKRFISRVGRFTTSQQVSPDSPSTDVGIHLAARCNKNLFQEGDSPSDANVYEAPDSSNLPSKAESTEGNLLLPDAGDAKKTDELSELLENISKIEEAIPSQEVFPNQTDSFLENLGLHPDSPRKNLSPKETEEKFIALALAWNIDAESTKERFENQREICSQLKDQYLKHLLEIVHFIKQHRCEETKQPFIQLLRQVDMLRSFITEFFVSAEQCGSLKYEMRTMKCWNLVTNYVAILRKEQHSSYRSTDEKTRTKPCNLLEEKLEVVPIATLTVAEEVAPPIDAVVAPPVAANTSLVHFAILKVKKLIPFVLSGLAIVFLGVLYIHWECIRNGATAICPLDSVFSFFIKETTSGLRPL